MCLYKQTYLYKHIIFFFKLVKWYSFFTCPAFDINSKSMVARARLTLKSRAAQKLVAPYYFKDIIYLQVALNVCCRAISANLRNCGKSRTLSIKVQIISQELMKVRESHYTWTKLNLWTEIASPKGASEMFWL